MDIIFVMLIFLLIFGVWFHFDVARSQKRRDAYICEVRRELEEGLDQVGREIDTMSRRTDRRVEDKPLTKEYLSGLTKPEIEDLGDRYNVKLSLYRQKNEMIQDFISQMNGK